MFLGGMIRNQWHEMSCPIEILSIEQLSNYSVSEMLPRTSVCVKDDILSRRTALTLLSIFFDFLIDRVINLTTKNLSTVKILPKRYFFY